MSSLLMENGIPFFFALNLAFDNKTLAQVDGLSFLFLVAALSVAFHDFRSLAFLSLYIGLLEMSYSRFAIFDFSMSIAMVVISTEPSLQAGLSFARFR